MCARTNKNRRKLCNTTKKVTLHIITLEYIEWMNIRMYKQSFYERFQIKLIYTCPEKNCVKPKIAMKCFCSHVFWLHHVTYLEKQPLFLFLCVFILLLGYTFWPKNQIIVSTTLTSGRYNPLNTRRHNALTSLAGRGEQDTSVFTWPALFLSSPETGR